MIDRYLKLMRLIELLNGIVYIKKGRISRTDSRSIPTFNIWEIRGWFRRVVNLAGEEYERLQQGNRDQAG